MKTVMLTTALALVLLVARSGALPLELIDGEFYISTLIARFMGPVGPSGPHVGPMNLAIWVNLYDYNLIRACRSTAIAIAGAVILVPYHVARSLSLIWRSGSCRVYLIYRCPISKWATDARFEIRVPVPVMAQTWPTTCRKDLFEMKHGNNHLIHVKMSYSKAYLTLVEKHTNRWLSARLQ